MRHLSEAESGSQSTIRLVTMQGLYDCYTCVLAMLLDMPYEEVRDALGGNLDPSKGKKAETERLYYAGQELLDRRAHAYLMTSMIPSIRPGRRYWIAFSIDDPSNPLSQEMTHSIVVDESGQVFDPNPQYGKFSSLDEWHSAMTLGHEISHAYEMFSYSH